MNAKRIKPPSVGANVRRLRRNKQFTIDALAAAAGISKSMLSEIERDLTNPTIATLWRLANALSATIGELVTGETRRNEIEIVSHHAIPRIRSKDSKVTLAVLSPLSMAGKVEWYELTAAPAGALVSEAHSHGTVEHLTVLSGTLVIKSGAEEVIVHKGDTARYVADVPHIIKNQTKRPALAILVVSLR